MQDLPEFKALEDEEGRRAAFSKFVKRQKVRDLLMNNLRRAANGALLGAPAREGGKDFGGRRLDH